ncbi:hypothetical protein V5O48_003330 [Marasmius crinis-equi]|uniref:RING-type domain-containing protein n=1 Tax=Marasmius crinis-equi TaxID=585013 RepID=A0ABR3FU79_9AGAR
MTTGGRPPKRMLAEAASIVYDDAIYISSDEDEQNDWRIQVEKLRSTTPSRMASEGTGYVEREKKRVKHELELLEHKIQGIRQRTVQLESHLTCSICDEIFTSPHLLTACGHVFCRKCLREWFSTILEKYRSGRRYDPSNVPLSRHIRDGLITARSLQDVQELLRGLDRPQFTCPACRTQAVDKPVEVYPLKAIARTILPERAGEIGKEGWEEFWPSKRLF